MGTSKRNINKKIRDLLKDKPNQKITETLPELTPVILTKRKLRLAFQKDIFDILVSAGIAGIGSLKRGTFDQDYELSEQPSLEEIQEDVITRDKIIEKIIEIAEESCDEDFSELLLQAFKLAMAATIQGDLDIYSFVAELCFQLVYLLVQNELLEVLSDTYMNLQHEEIDELIKNQINTIVSDDIYADVKKYTDKELTLEQLIKKISDKASSLKFGEF